MVGSSGNQYLMSGSCDSLRKRAGFKEAKHKELAGLENCCGEEEQWARVSGQRVTILTAGLSVDVRRTDCQ